MKTIILLITCLNLSLLDLLAQENEHTNNPKNEVMKVAIKEAAPFVIKDQNGKWSGISVELWEAVAKLHGISFVYQEYDLEGVLKGLNNKEFDLAVGALTLTEERERSFDFSHPFYESGLGIAVRTRASGIYEVIQRLFSSDFFKAVGGLVVVLLIFGLLVWLFERKKNKEQFGGKPWQGIASGFWWSAVTMTTVGYGDKAPVSAGGRIIALVWMFMALIIISSFTAAITSALTVNELSTMVTGPEDLKDVRVASVASSSSGEFLVSNQIEFRHFSELNDALAALENGKIDAVVYDKPIMSYLLKNTSREHVEILPQDLIGQYYGFGLPEGHPFREELNIALLQIISTGHWQEILFRYLGNRN
jgi:ABC-type amino acid transport substrate-binding protein